MTFKAVILYIVADDNESSRFLLVYNRIFTISSATAQGPRDALYG